MVDVRLAKPIIVMAKRQIKPKSFTDEEGELKALIGKDAFLVFFFYNDK